MFIPEKHKSRKFNDLRDFKFQGVTEFRIDFEIDSQLATSNVFYYLQPLRSVQKPLRVVQKGLRDIQNGLRGFLTGIQCILIYGIDTNRTS